jgi:hypothetical protein
MISSHIIQEISFERNTMTLKIDDHQIKVDLDAISPRLKGANDMQRQFYKVSPSGYGIHWPLIDEDLSVDVILKTIKH